MISVCHTLAQSQVVTPLAVLKQLWFFLGSGKTLCPPGRDLEGRNKFAGVQAEILGLLGATNRPR